ncbi:MAG: hypothetical protein ACYC5Y_12515 [Symbiobacteriia bacterium]
MRLKRGFRPVDLLPVLGVFAVGALWDPRWEGFMVFLLVPVVTHFRPDERFRTNLGRAARNAFFLAMGGLTVLSALTLLQPAEGILAGGIAGLYVLLAIFFTVSLVVYERQGS